MSRRKSPSSSSSPCKVLVDRKWQGGRLIKEAEEWTVEVTMRVSPDRVRRVELKGSPPPHTDLRVLYEALRSCAKSALLNPLTPLLEGNPTVISALYDRATKQFAKFDALSEPFVPEKRADTDSEKFAHRLAFAMKRASDAGRPRIAGSDFDFVERELSTTRIRGADARASGAGGIDVLFAHEGVPVIGEVKATGDMTPLFAVIQALTYAAELVTDAQQRRLAKHYPTPFSGLQRKGQADGPGRAELCLMFETGSEVKKAKPLVLELMERKGLAIQRSIRAITLCEATVGESGPGFVNVETIKSKSRD